MKTYSTQNIYQLIYLTVTVSYFLLYEVFQILQVHICWEELFKILRCLDY